MEKLEKLRRLSFFYLLIPKATPQASIPCIPNMEYIPYVAHSLSHACLLPQYEYLTRSVFTVDKIFKKHEKAGIACKCKGFCCFGYEKKLESLVNIKDSVVMGMRTAGITYK